MPKWILEMDCWLYLNICGFIIIIIINLQYGNYIITNTDANIKIEKTA